MKRSRLLRKSPLRSKPKRVNRSDPARIAWKTPVAGFCQCGCGRFSMHLHRHHVLLEQIIRRENGDVYDPDNGMLLDPRCHASHHAASRKIPIENVPEPAVRFTIRVLGMGGALEYFRRRYGCEEGGVIWCRDEDVAA